MAKIKHTKNELKAQRDALKRFQRYLPTLQLKKQQLQLEMRNLEKKIEELLREQRHEEERLKKWVALFSEPFDFEAHLRLVRLETSTGNIAGVTIPVFEKAIFEETTPDLLATPPWVDDGMRALKHMTEFRLQREILEEEHRLLGEELRVTNQRVNLFEKVKIPEAKEHIRVIRVFLGDQQTAEVARAKIAKGKAVARENAA